MIFISLIHFSKSKSFVEWLNWVFRKGEDNHSNFCRTQNHYLEKIPWKLEDWLENRVYLHTPTRIQMTAAAPKTCWFLQMLQSNTRTLRRFWEQLCQALQNKEHPIVKSRHTRSKPLNRLLWILSIEELLVAIWIFHFQSWPQESRWLLPPNPFPASIQQFVPPSYHRWLKIKNKSADEFNDSLLISNPFWVIRWAQLRRLLNFPVSKIYDERFKVQLNVTRLSYFDKMLQITGTHNVKI